MNQMTNHLRRSFDITFVSNQGHDQGRASTVRQENWNSNIPEVVVYK